MRNAKRLIIGLGNPGTPYEGTRHNIGFTVVDALADRAGLTFVRKRGNVVTGWGRYRGTSFGLAKPATYMNLCGTAVKSLLGRHKLAPAEMLIIVDDINLEPGRIRIREHGSAGGHNGLQDIIDVINTDRFPRLRIGIGNNFPPGHQSDYVLSPFTGEEALLMQDVIEKACKAALTFARDGIVIAMNRFN